MRCLCSLRILLMAIRCSKCLTLMGDSICAKTIDHFVQASSTVLSRPQKSHLLSVATIAVLFSWTGPTSLVRRTPHDGGHRSSTLNLGRQCLTVGPLPGDGW